MWARAVPERQKVQVNYAVQSLLVPVVGGHRTGPAKCLCHPCQRVGDVPRNGVSYHRPRLCLWPLRLALLLHISCGML